MDKIISLSGKIHIQYFSDNVDVDPLTTLKQEARHDSPTKKLHRLIILRGINRLIQSCVNNLSCCISSSGTITDSILLPTCNEVHKLTKSIAITMFN
jgi:hypothetical protein